MPIDVDLDQRLAKIAEATLQIVEAEGIDGVTIRAVAKLLGGSTTLVTNYLPTRSALLRNAMEHALRDWSSDLDRVLEDTTGSPRLLGLARWACTTTDDDPVLRKLFMELIGRGGPDGDMVDVLREDGRQQRDLFRDAAQDVQANDPDFLADVMHLVLRGFYVASLEDPELWNSATVTPIVERLVDLLTTLAPNTEATARRARSAHTPQFRST
ncbi:AcrR family transcriptional regulator [Kibdelosporangium banguiense]|uniref:AcrR family transcriptional regulator n=1 Tax=Kibdelosporangium banguiense TaxID=1365924 RepID=A0ABS4TXU3_9PSEU|nr:TetR/AcrR family transcriptional regulator [Kibdelosporangium banguiense]MBP2329204.1 AcrR family transcriptional regulator [Kibdelosporangium banguiense]